MKSQVMKRAWKIFKTMKQRTMEAWSAALKAAWLYVKNERLKMEKRLQQKTQMQARAHSYQQAYKSHRREQLQRRAAQQATAAFQHQAMIARYGCEVIAVEANILFEEQKASMVSFGTSFTPSQLWIPNSQIKESRGGKLYITKWYAQKKRLPIAQ